MLLLLGLWGWNCEAVESREWPHRRKLWRNMEKICLHHSISSSPWLGPFYQQRGLIIKQMDWKTTLQYRWAEKRSMVLNPHIGCSFTGFFPEGCLSWGPAGHMAQRGLSNNSGISAHAQCAHLLKSLRAITRCYTPTEGGTYGHLPFVWCHPVRLGHFANESASTPGCFCPLSVGYSFIFFMHPTSRGKKPEVYLVPNIILAKFFSSLSAPCFPVLFIVCSRP